MHNLFGERYIGMRIPAWHHLGITKSDDEQIDAVEAFRLAGLNYRFHKLPIGVTLPNGTFYQTSDDFAVYREPTPDDDQWRSLGIVAKSYEFLQNEDLAAGIDAISKKTGWQFETAGALGKGETIFVCLKTGKHSIKGDEMDSYFLVSDGKAANRALKIAVTPVRVVCQNTLIMADSSEDLSITVPHTAGVESQYQFWLDMIASLEQSQESAFEDLRRMAEARISDEIAKGIFMDAFPEPTKNHRVRMSEKLPEKRGITPELLERANAELSKDTQAYEYNLRQSQKWNEASFDLYRRFNDGAEQGGSMSPAALKNLAGTAYAALQAVTELCDWGGTNRDSVASATLFGARAAQKTRAWSSALQAANATLN